MCVYLALPSPTVTCVFSLPPSLSLSSFFSRLSVLDHVLIQKMILNLCSYLSCDSVYSSLPLFRGRKWSFLLHRLIPLSNTRFWIVWLNLFMQVQVVGGWTSHRKSQDTQGARFLLLLGSAGSLLPGLSVSNFTPLLFHSGQKGAPSPQSSCVVFDCPGSYHFHWADEQMVPWHKVLSHG